MKKNNINRLKDEANIQSVLDYFGISYKRSGSSYFLLCPNPTHSDTKANNCYFKEGWKNVLCQSCGASIKAIDLIMVYAHCDYGTACDILWEIQGRPDWYYAEQELDSNGSHKKSLYVVRDEMLFIGVMLPSKTVTFAEIKTDKSDLKNIPVYDYDAEAYLGQKNVHINWSDFCSESEFVDIVLNKADEKCQQIVIDRMLGNISSREQAKLFAKVGDIRKKVLPFRK